MVRKKVPREKIGNLRIKSHVLDMLHLGAAYHEIGYQTYLQWLVEEGLKAEAKYYGWLTPATRLKTEGLTLKEKQEIQRLMRMADRKVKRENE